jgi:IPT/TIG domain
MTTVDPKSGTTQGGTPVKISGGPWDEDTVTFTTVMFGESVATDVTGEVKNAQGKYTSIRAVSPPHSAGVVDITVITPDGSDLRIEKAFTYTLVVTSVNPSLGQLADAKDGNIAVIIKGEDFIDVGEVKFGEEAARFAVISESEILAVVPPAKRAGEVVVTVKTPDGQNTEKPTFEYRASLKR